MCCGSQKLPKSLSTAEYCLHFLYVITVSSYYFPLDYCSYAGLSIMVLSYLCFMTYYLHHKEEDYCTPVEHQLLPPDNSVEDMNVLVLKLNFKIPRKENLWTTKDNSVRHKRQWTEFGFQSISRLAKMHNSQFNTISSGSRSHVCFEPMQFLQRVRDFFTGSRLRLPFFMHFAFLTYITTNTFH